MGNYDNQLGSQLRAVFASLFSFASEDDRNILYALLGAGAGTPIGSFVKAADDAMASTTTAEAIVGPINPMNAFFFSSGATARPIRCLGMRVGKTTATGVTSNDTNYGTVKLSHRTAAGATLTDASAQGTQTAPSGGTGDWPAATLAAQQIAAISGAGANMAAGGVMTTAITKTGTGIIIPAGVFNVFGALA